MKTRTGRVFRCAFLPALQCALPPKILEEKRDDIMNERDVAELRRRFRADKSGITRVRGCYVNDRQEIIREFDQSLGLLSQEENEQLLTILKKCLSGGLGKTLRDITFTTNQVVDSPEHKLLTRLRNSTLGDEEAVGTLFQEIAQARPLEGNYLILLAFDAYDIPYRAKDGMELGDAGSEVFPYLICALCPIKPPKPALGYQVNENAFLMGGRDVLVGKPELGFLFPACEGRSANLYGALCYARDTAATYESFVRAIFRREPPMPAAAQREVFYALLEESLGADCSLEVLQAIHQELSGRMEDHKESRNPEALTLDKGDWGRVLSACGVEAPGREAFAAGYDTAFGEGTALPPGNLVDTGRMELTTPEVSIRVAPNRPDAVETRRLGGIKYILIRADEGVEVNGVNVEIS